MNMLTSPRTVIILGSPGVGLSSYSKHGSAWERLKVVREVRRRAPNHNGCDLGHSHNVGGGPPILIPIAGYWGSLRPEKQVLHTKIKVQA
jgi:hypothetical protein